MERLPKSEVSKVSKKTSIAVVFIIFGTYFLFLIKAPEPAYFLAPPPALINASGSWGLPVSGSEDMPPSIPVRTALGPEMQQKFQEIHRKRKEHLLKECEREPAATFGRKNKLASVRGRFELADEHKILNCQVYKAGSTSYNVVLAHLYKKREFLNSKQYYRMGDILRPSLSKFLTAIESDDYIRFMIAREPLSRVLSSYRNRIADISHSSWQAHHYVPYILKYTRRKSYKDTELFYPNSSIRIVPSFKEFISWLVMQHPSQMDPHWRPIHDTCVPCLINYTHIVHTETLTDDLRFILELSGINKKVDLSILNLHSNPGIGSTNKLKMSYYSTITPELGERLYRLYEKDFRMFGYDAEKLFREVQLNFTVPVKG
ncbi:carbohydrate sulfotransferase 11-like isoform X1 [Oratosquilla oratoria]|uniref:carbohydrate sulfotransferase 11-like isoform X1 n=1 Tax=Oratosquilla oratoria TaxID=337810 RepID=UPI003F76E029